MNDPASCPRPDRDRWIRVALFAAGSLSVAAALLGAFSPWGYAGVSLMATAWLGRCPACRMLGIDQDR